MDIGGSRGDLNHTGFGSASFRKIASVAFKSGVIEGMLGNWVRVAQQGHPIVRRRIPGTHIGGELMQSACQLESRCHFDWMEESRSDRDASESLSPGSRAAAQLLSQTERVSAHVLNQTDFRADALIQGWVAAALFAYVATFLVVFTAPGTSEAGRSPGSSYRFNLLIPFLLLSQLVQGARNRLPIMSSFPQRRASKLLVFLPGPAVFFAAAAACSAGVRLPWWVSLLAAFAAAVPPASASILVSLRP